MRDSAGPVGASRLHVEMRRNQWHTLVILLAFAALMLVVGVVVDLAVGLGVVGAVVVLLLAALATAGAYFGATPIVLAAAHARPAEPAEFPRYHNLVEGLCAAAGLSKPSLYVVDDPAPNALGGRPRPAPGGAGRDDRPARRR